MAQASWSIYADRYAERLPAMRRQVRVLELSEAVFLPDVHTDFENQLDDLLGTITAALAEERRHLGGDG